MRRDIPHNKTWASATSTALRTRRPVREVASGGAGGSLSAMEVVKAFRGRVTYRMLDYWLRMGIASCSNASDGSGSRRSFDRAEIAALDDIIEIRAKTLETLAEFSSGELFAERLAYHRGAERLHLVGDDRA